MTLKTTEDQAARDRIAADLDTNMLVEAGAGSGKTTSLVGRMHALVMRGEPVERIAAVTFTRKAANELRERFQLRLDVADRPGVLAQVAAAHAAHGVSIEAVRQAPAGPAAHLVITTHATSERALRATVEAVRRAVAAESAGIDP